MEETWSFIQHITDSMMRSRPGDPRQPTLWPSEASAEIVENGITKLVGKCRRASFFRYLVDSYKFYPKYRMWAPLIKQVQAEYIPADPYLVWIGRQGELYEEFVIQQAKVSGVFIAEQVPLYIAPWNISGKKDVEVINPETRKLSIVECKSVYGYGANTVLGTPGARRNGNLGTPRESNLMQSALYHWWTASEDDHYEESRLVYGSRDTGRFGEYLVKTEKQDNINKILYKPNVASKSWITSPITIEAILKEYANQQFWLDSGIIPDRDYDLEYSEEKLAALYAANELAKTDAEKYEAVMSRREENLQRISEGKKPKKELKQLQKGDWQCSFCNYRNTCYTQDNSPRTI